MSDIFRGWVTQAWRQKDADHKIIQLQKICIFGLFVIAVLTIIGWMYAPSKLTVYIPPDIQNGATVRPEQIPNPLIYSFAYEIWQELNYWPEENGDLYEKSIHQYWPYLTSKFKTDLLEDAKQLRQAGQLSRTRNLQGMSGSAFDATNVKRLSKDTWEVDLRMRLSEYKNGQVIKDIEINYPLRVTRYNISNENNPYGLALDGFVEEPERLKTYI